VDSLLNQKIFHPSFPKRKIVLAIELLNFILGACHIYHNHQSEYRTLAMITLVVENAAITINKTIITQKNTKNLRGSFIVKYVHMHRQLRRNLLSKMQYKIVKRKSDVRASLGFLFSCIFLLLFILRRVVLFYFRLYVI
jgi:hypothetical protein